MPDRAVFLDRDDTLIRNQGSINHPNQVELLESVPEVLIELRALGYKLIVVSNQPAVAQGIVTENVLAEIHNRLEQLLSQKGARLDRIYYCPYHPDGVIPEYSKDSECRKPNPGMLVIAAQEMDIDLKQSWMIGNGGEDIEAGRRAGCRTILINHSGQTKQASPDEAAPDHTAVNIREAANIIKRYHRGPSQLKGYSATEAPEESVLDTKRQTQPEAPQPMRLEDTPQTPPGRTEQLLTNILEQLKSMQRATMFHEFSVTRLIAGILQVVVFFCLLVTVWFLTSPPGQDNAVLISLGFAVVLQLMSLTFYMMRGPK